MTSHPGATPPNTPAAVPPADDGRQLQLHLFVRGHLADALRATLAHLVATAADSDSSSGGIWTPQHASFGALSRRTWALSELVDLLERGQREKTLPPLSFQAYDQALWKEHGDVVMVTPDLGRFDGRCDSQGNVVLTDRRIAAALAGASDAAAAAAIAGLAGLPWSTELGLLTASVTAADQPTRSPSPTAGRAAAGQP